MPKLPVESLPSNDSGRLIVRLNYKYRNSVDRYGIAKLVNNENNKAIFALMLGHDREDAIFMPYDLRRDLGLRKGEQMDFEIKAASKVDKIKWFLGSPDPAVNIPAWIAVIALSLSVVALVIGVISLFV